MAKPRAKKAPQKRSAKRATQDEYTQRSDLTDEQKAFLRAFKKTRNKAASARAAGRSRTTVYQEWMAIEAFRQALDDLIEELADDAEAQWSRAATKDWRAAQAFLDRYRPNDEGGGGGIPRVVIRRGAEPARVAEERAAAKKKAEGNG